MHGNRHKKGDESRPGPFLAVLDLGTNNCRLLIAKAIPAKEGDGDFRVVDSFSRIVRLGEGVGQSGLLSDAALDRTIAALKICSERIGKYPGAHVWAIATQAARLARNADVLIDRAKREAGLDLSVITADAEADLAALGCAPLIGRRYDGALVFDIGGGSTEIIWLAKSQQGPQKKMAVSVPLGVVSLAERYGPAASTPAGFESMREELRAHLAPFAAATGKSFDPARYHLLGTSGTITTLAAITLNLPRYNRARVDGSWHETRQLQSVVDRLVGLNKEALAGIGGIGAERADLMLPGCAIFAAIVSLWPSPMLRVADRGLREGMLRQLSQELS